MAIAIVLVVVGVIFIPKLKPKPVEIEATPTPVNTRVVVVQYDIEDVKEVTLEYDGQTTTIFYDEADSLYKVRGYEDVAIDQTSARDIVRTASHVEAEDTIREDLNNLPEYGLDDPIATITAKYSDGKTNTYYFGNNAPGSGTYYMLIDGIDKVYNVWNNYGNNAQYNIYSLRSIEIRAIDMAATKIVRLFKDGEIHMEVTSTSGKESKGIGSWELTAPYEKGIHTNVEGKSFYKMAELIGKVIPRAVLPSDDIAEYELDNPWGTLEVISKFDQTVTILFGKNVDGLVAMKYADSDILYWISEAKLGMFNYETIDIIERLLNLINVSNVTSVKMTGVVGDNTLTVKHEKVKEDDGTYKLDTKGEIVEKRIYVVDGVELTEDEEDQGSWFYQSLIIPKIVREVEDESYSQGKLLGSVEYTLMIEPFSHRIEFYKYDEYFYAVKIQDSNTYLLVNKDDIDIIPTYYEMLRDREMVDPITN